MKKNKTLCLILTLALCLGLSTPAFAYDVGKTGAHTVISVGQYHLAVIDKNNILWTWGSNDYGQLGNNTTEDSEVPVKVMENVVAVSCGFRHTAAIQADGSLWMWGSNEYGELGNGKYGLLDNGTTEKSLLPVKVLDNVATVSCGFGYTAAIKTDGSLWMWGHNDYGQLGNEGLGNASYLEEWVGTIVLQTVPEKVMENVIAVSCGDSHTAAIKVDGSLWMWGHNDFGQLGNGKAGNAKHAEWDFGGTPIQTVPVKVMDSMAIVSCGHDFTAAIQTDGSLWMWGSTALGDGISNGSDVPVKIMGDVTTVSCGNNQTAVLKSDGSLWMWGQGSAGQLGNGTDRSSDIPLKVMDDMVAVSCGNDLTGAIAALKFDGSLWMWGAVPGNGKTMAPLKVMDNVATPNASATSTTSTMPSNIEYLYNVSDPGESVTLNTSQLDAIIDTTSAVSAVQTQIQSMTTKQKDSATGVDLATLYAETAVSKAASKEVTGKEIIINKAAVTDLEAVAAQTSSAVETALVNGGVTTARLVSNTVTLTTDETGEITIKIDPDILTTKVDKIRVETPTYAITLKVADLEEDLSSGIITINSEDVGSGFAPGNQNKKTTVKVNLPKGKTANPVTLSLPKDGDDTTYQAVVKTDGTATSSKYNPATTTMDGKVNTSGSYTVQTNQKDFTDIANKSAEMQKAIRYLASKGIINGTSATEFSPDGSINRAEIAALLVRALGKLDNGATNNFTDVKSSDWFYSTAGSSQKCGLIKGYTDNTFRGTTPIIKDQILAVAARVLKNEMGYKEPSDLTSYLAKYSDTVTKWAQPEVALATKENLVVYRVDGTFKGESNMTRGDAAIIIYRLFQKIW